MDLADLLMDMGVKAKGAARVLARTSTRRKNRALLTLADLLVIEKGFIQKENEKDVADAENAGLTRAKIDRLTLSDKVIDEMVAALKEVAALPDPVGEVTSMWRRPNDLLVGRMRIPLGVIAIIYESRPNVTIDAASLCLKAGNAVILRGGSEAINSNKALSSLIARAMTKAGLPGDTVQVVPVTDRAAVNHLLALEDHVDVVIPRGGEPLIRFVAEHARMPVLKHYKGVCHVYVDRGADPDMAVTICMNAKVQRPGVCNAMETLLVHRDEAASFLPKVAESLMDAGVELRGCDETRKILPDAARATEKDWPEEYLDLILAIKVVSGMDEAMDHIAAFGSDHTEAIVTRDYERAQRFLREVDSSLVLVNASTRFNDGGQLGLGAEIGISTSKLHSFGPMGLEELTSRKFIVYGQGQVRE